MSKNTGFRNELLALEPLNPERQRRFEQQIHDLVDGKLSRGARLYWLLFLSACVWQVMFFGYNLIVAPLQGTLLWGIALCFAASALCGGYILFILIRGRVDFRLQLALGKLLPAVGLIIVFLSFLYGMEDPRKPGADFFGIYALAVLVITFGITLWNRIVAADLKTQEHLLRLEYQLAELATRLPPCEQPFTDTQGTD